MGGEEGGRLWEIVNFLWNTAFNLGTKYSLGSAKSTSPVPPSPQDNVLADLPLGLIKLKHVLELLDLSHNRLQQV